MADQSNGTSAVVVARNELARLGAAHSLEDGGVLVLALGEDPAAIPALVRRFDPTVVLMDGDPSPTQAVEEVRARLSSAAAPALLVIASDSHASTVERTLGAGAHGFVLWSTRAADLGHAVRTVALGGRYLHPKVGAQVLVERTEIERTGLTERELEVVRLVVLGHTNREIAKLIHASVRTVESHRSHIMTKLRMERRSELVAWAFDHRVVTPETAPV